LMSRTQLLRKPQKQTTILPRNFSQQWNFEHLSGQQYFLRLKTAITQTGSDVTTLLNLQFHGKMLELILYHYDSTNVLNHDPLNFTIYSQDGANWTINAKRDASISSSTDVSYLDEGGRIFNPCQFKLITNTTAGHLIQLTARVEVLL